MSNSNKQYLNFKKEEIEKAGGYIKTDNDGQIYLFLDLYLAINSPKKKIQNQKNKRNFWFQIKQQ